MATERLPGFERQVAISTEDEHRARLAGSDARYLIAHWPDGPAQGFALLEGVHDRHQGVKLRRIAVLEPGRGFGRPFTAALIDWTFAHTDTARLWLDVFVDNPRARHVYRSLGFREDGILRQAYLRGEERVDRVLMSILRDEWRSE
jgi:diamine N-acetyltransferase